MGKKKLQIIPKINQNELITEIRELIYESRHSISILVNAALTKLYWKIGEKISNEILNEN